MEKKNLDWSNIGFGYMVTDKRYVADYKDGEWGKGELTSDANIVLNECAGILQYCQECFEGLKAYTTADGSVVTFRPDLNAERMMILQPGWRCRLFRRRDSWRQSMRWFVPIMRGYRLMEVGRRFICARICSRQDR